MENKKHPPVVSRIYSEDLKNYLRQCGFRYLIKARDIVTNEVMWVFPFSMELIGEIRKFVADNRPKENS